MDFDHHPGAYGASDHFFIAPSSPGQSLARFYAVDSVKNHSFKGDNLC
jgi:hypothetical protein